MQTYDLSLFQPLPSAFLKPIPLLPFSSDSSLPHIHPPPILSCRPNVKRAAVNMDLHLFLWYAGVLHM